MGFELNQRGGERGLLTKRSACLRWFSAIHPDSMHAPIQAQR